MSTTLPAASFLPAASAEEDARAARATACAKNPAAVPSASHAALSAPTPGAVSSAASSGPAALPPVAALESVVKRYRKIEALRGLDLTMHRGEILALLGPNGAGKTTAVRLLLGLISPDEGRARVLGRDPRLADARARIGAMLQVARVPEALLVREHIALFRSYYPRPLSTAEVLARAGLEGIENRRFGELSGGQRQRVLFGLALCGDPDLLFLDEPTVGMDLQSRRRLWDEVRSLAAAGKSVLLTTHYLEEADALAHRVVVIDKGRVLAEGMPGEIKHGVSGRRIRCVTDLDAARVRALFGIGATLALERSQGWLDLKRASPMPRLVLIGAKVVTSAAFGLIIASLLLALGTALGGITITGAQVAALMGVILAGSIPFTSMGLLIALLVPPNAGPAIINLIYLPLSFASGFWMPLRALPHWLRLVAPALPTYHLAQLALAVLGLAPASGRALHRAVLAGFTLLMLTAAWITFQRKENGV